MSATGTHPPQTTTSKTVFDLQQAFKLAFSLTLFYALALWTNWDEPQYGALAIAIISLGTTKATIEKGMMRFVGTTVGVAVGFLVLALFNFDRWATMVAFAVYITGIGYVMQGSRNSYAWYVAAFVPLVVWGDTYPNFESAFYFGTFRYLQTTVGILIYTTVDLVMWPRYAKAPPDSPTEAVPRSSCWDRGRWILALFPATAFIAAFFIWVIMNPPTGPKVAMFAGVLSLVILRTPMNPMAILAVFFLSIFVVVAPVYWLVMPGLSTGVGLLSLIFLYSFIFGTLGGRSPALKAGPIIIFVMMCGISNQQSYSFQGLVDAGIMVLLAGIVVATTYFLFVPSAVPHTANA